MSQRLAAFVVLSALAAHSPATAAAVDQWTIPEPDAPRSKVNFRLVQDPVFSPTPIHNSGMIAQTEVAPNAAIGIGLLKSTQRKREAGEWRLDERSAGSRKAAVRILFKF